jgi:hypothetical protein
MIQCKYELPIEFEHPRYTSTPERKAETRRWDARWSQVMTQIGNWIKEPNQWIIYKEYLVFGKRWATIEFHREG